MRRQEPTSGDLNRLSQILPPRLIPATRLILIEASAACVYGTDLAATNSLYVCVSPGARLQSKVALRFADEANPSGGGIRVH